ncbi:MAG: Quinone oxidoreductase putative YhdH/YhfP [Firmicutes bacterium]|nr:Quinone oxidoreductase putative YhdH/YhfP [Bacillota bacterium]
MDGFKALLVKEENGAVVCSLEEITTEQLSPGNVLIKVAYSSVNYKDYLAVQTGGGVIRNYPMIPGIDLSGTVVSSEDDRFQTGQEVLVTGFQMGMSHTGGYAEYARIPADWIVPLPAGLSLRDAMVIGTAGFTAALSINALESAGMNPENNPEILVTGAAGGVGSIAVQLLARSGYRNINALSKNAQKDEAVLGTQRFHYVLDVVGGGIASALLPQIHYGGSMSMCGNAGGVSIQTTVMPFILRGVNLLGIDSVNYPAAGRPAIWERFAGQWHVMADSIVREVGLSDLPQVFDEIRQGTHMGRNIVKHG